MARYSKFNSNYIKSQTHKHLKDGNTIFERDWVTIGSQLNFGPGKVPYYNDGNFIFTTTRQPFFQKRYQNAIYVGTWQYDDVKDAKPTVNRIMVNEYTEDIRSYAYYGSCVELIRSTFEKIIQEFPGNITRTNNVLIGSIGYDFTDKTFKYFENKPNEKIEGEDFIVCSSFGNPTLIYQWTGLSYIPREDLHPDFIKCILQNEEELIYVWDQSRETHTYTPTSTANILNNPFDINVYLKDVNLTKTDNELHYLTASYSKYTLNGKDIQSVNSDIRTLYQRESQSGDGLEFQMFTEEEYNEFSDQNWKPSNCVLKNWLPDVNHNATFTTAIECDGDTYYIEGYIYDGQQYYTTTNDELVLQPRDEIIEDYFANLKGFEKQLLTRKTTPLYTNTFLTPIQIGESYISQKRNYTWPSNGYCIDVTSSIYDEFVREMVGLGELLDNTSTDNLWRNMTHEAIKNYDWTYTREFEDGDEADNVEGGERMHKVLNIIARAFDDVKSNIDVIRRQNRITYNSSQNIPNALLSDKLELLGWDTYSTIPTYFEQSEDGSEIFDELPNYQVSGLVRVMQENEDVLYYVWDDATSSYKEIERGQEKIQIGDTYYKWISLGSGDWDYVEYYRLCNTTSLEGFDCEDCKWYPTLNKDNVYFDDVDVEFMRRMVLSAKHILKTKGTKSAIDMVMGMFGYGDNDYEIKEEYYTVTPRPYDECEYDGAESFGDTIVRLNRVKTYNKQYEEDASGIPVGSFIVEDINDDVITQHTYLIPYYSPHKTYDGDITFQSNGGWFYYGRTSDENFGSDEFAWSETMPYLRVAPYVRDLFALSPTEVDEGDIIYVANTSDYSDYTENLSQLYSGFFVLINHFSPDEIASWVSLDLSLWAYAIDEDNDSEEVKEKKREYMKYAQRANYLNKILPINEGNNPHVGYGYYDMGSRFFDYMAHPFKFAVHNSLFNNSEDKEAAENIIFDISDPIIGNGKDKIHIFTQRYLRYIPKTVTGDFVTTTYQGDLVYDETNSIYYRWDKSTQEYTEYNIKYGTALPTDYDGDYFGLGRSSIGQMEQTQGHGIGSVGSVSDTPIATDPTHNGDIADGGELEGGEHSHLEPDTEPATEPDLPDSGEPDDPGNNYPDIILPPYDVYYWETGTNTIPDDGSRIVYGGKNKLRYTYYNDKAFKKQEKEIYHLNSKAVFMVNQINNPHYKDYFKNIIAKYLMQVIPSTTIFVLVDF